MVPGGRYFRICVASASADTASFPSPTGGATTGNWGRKQAEKPGGWASHPETASAEAHYPASRLGARRRALGAAADRVPPNPRPPHPSNPQPHLCPPLHHARGSSSSPRSLPLTLQERLGSAPHARTLAGVGSRREQCFCRTNPDTRRTHRTVAASRGAEGNVPCRPPHRPPFSAPVHTSNQQRRRARRAEVRSVAGSAAADSPPPNKPKASKSRKPRARAPHSHLFLRT
uniref:uncharacterized protein LOC117712574 n=1 Tax=Arvicanthis niloticus TaxID=61156 RepID=UPI001485E5AA|nr:uncharacterized protein LOC117712574 [Arvicanthis niloticus]